MTAHLLSILIVIPLLGAFAAALTKREQAAPQRSIGIAASVATLIAALFLLAGFEDTPGMQFEERYEWVRAFGISYHVGVDGISLWLIVLTAFVTPLALIASWTAIETRVREFVVFMLLCESAMLGVFCALDLFLFYVFWEAVLIPMYFLIGVFGHARRIYAAVKFFLFTMAGSVLMLVALLAVYIQSGRAGFGLEELKTARIAPEMQLWLFLAFALAFAIKVPMFPLHTWLPDAHVEAPTAGSVILAGVLLKMGAYGFIRIALPLFPQAAMRCAPYIVALAVIGILYGAWVCLVQTDMKKLVAYSSVSHMGFVMLGVAACTSLSMTGAIYQMLNHGVATGALFLLVGMLYERRHTREIAAFTGLRAVAPWLSAVFILIALNSMAVPGFGGFVGEFVILVGSWPASRVGVSLAVGGVVLTAVYLLWLIERVFLGEVRDHDLKTMPDLTAREALVLVPLVALSLFMGIASPYFMRRIEPAAAKMAIETQDRAKISVMAPPAGESR
ncbi:MAG: NADH-quinone oxidoreductase subunit M [Vicinamibacteria bacterium]|jgi:NADH-quinone oxidoreductase subunit M|nr:NADH-quinone oxidoreductase subunit M [Vicinamibacteria bacterium]